jgi:predicted AlkP superfamily pyrophosphatase or phosphodiesterase
VRRLILVVLVGAGAAFAAVRVSRGGAADHAVFAKPVPAKTEIVVAKPVAEATPAPAMPPIFPTRVIIISEDGLRPDVLSEELTPRHMQLMREGANAQLAETIHESDTLPSHASMLSGFSAHDHGLHWNSYKADHGFIHVPTIFSIAQEHGLSTAMFVGKPKLRHIALPGSVDVFERPSYLCGGVSKRAAQYFVASKPDLMFVHFSDPDEYGHASGWMSKEYLKGAKQSDKCLATLLAAVDASGLGASTLVIVTADHGGHGKKHSGGHAEVDREIPWIVRGPGVAPGMRLDTPILTVDTAATTLAALRLPLPAAMIGTSRLAF